ncbi:MAG: amidohydrolase [Hyphomicrobium sp.]|jgi:predicted amidohydrolase YtcJ|nr:amidohydrolase [Hyphomicrobium sp.]
MARSAAICIAILAHASQTAYADSADKIWIGGPILTMNDAAMRTEAVAVKDGRILLVGSKADVLATKGETTQVIDLGGRALLPGFVDPHGHVMMGGLQALSANMLPPPDGKVSDIASLQATLREWAAANKETVDSAKLIFGFGYDHSQLKELRAPTKEELDAVSSDIPVVIVHQSGHIGAFNTKALEVAGITAKSENPPGGVIVRKPGGQEPIGVLEESAWFEALPKIFKNLGPASMQAMAKAGADMWMSFGYTTAQEGRSNKLVDNVLKSMTGDGSIKIDVVAYPDVLMDREYIKANASRDYKSRFRVGGAKLTIDGSAQGFTAWRDRPYVAPVGNYPPGYIGYPAVTNEQVIDALDWAYGNDLQILVHSNGEAASDLLIAAANAARTRHATAGQRPVLIHGQYLREDQVDSLIKLGIFPSLFTMHTFYWGDWHREHTVGPQLAENISPTGWFVARGSRYSAHTDAPVAFPDTMRSLDATVTRRTRSGDILGPSQRVDVITALKGMTIWPAYQHFEEATKGSLEPGKLADFVILSADPTAVDPDTLDELKIAETIKEGQTVYLRGQKKTELLRPRDAMHTGLHEMMKQVYIQKRMKMLPLAYRDFTVYASIADSYDDCFGSILLAEMFGLEDQTREVAEK